MQHRMKTYPLTKEQMTQLLDRAPTGSLATVNSDGTPYVTPVHFVYYKESIYIHGLPKGQKIDNIGARPYVSMTVYDMDRLLLDPDGDPCNTNTKYQSVVIGGQAALVDDPQLKREVLVKIVEKYTPHLSNKEMPENMIKGTAVMQIKALQMTGKYYE